MSISASQLRKLNRVFGKEFGFNPAGQPVFRFERTTALYRHVQSNDGLQKLASGVIVFEPKFEAVPWTRWYGDCWILCKWRAYTRDEWYAEVKNAVPFPENGTWEAVEDWRLSNKHRWPEPCVEAVNEACKDIKALRDRIMARFQSDATKDSYRRAEIEAESKAKHAAAVKSWESKVESELHDAVPAFGNTPGSHGGEVEFMSGK